MNDRDNSLFAFLLGAALGLAAGLLYAPKTGKETRAHLRKLTEDFVEDAEEVGLDLKERGKKFVADSKTKVSEKVSEIVEKGKASYSKAFKKQVPVAEEDAKEDVIEE